MADPGLVDPGLADPGLVDPGLADPETVPETPEDPAPAEALPPPCAAGEVLPDDEAGLLVGAVGLVVGEMVAAAPGLAEALEDVAVGLPQIVPLFCAVGVLLALALVLALAGADAVALDVAAAVLLALLAALGLPLPSDSPEEGLAGELAGVFDGLDELELELAGLDETVAGVVETAADDCGHDEIGDGRWCRAAVVEYIPPPPAAAWPLLLGAAGLAALLELLPLKADATDEVSACRSGGTEAMTTPTANTAQATAMAGLIRPIRQSRCAGRAGPAPVPLRRAFQRRTMSASRPVLAGVGLAWLACAVLIRARIRFRPSGCGSS